MEQRDELFYQLALLHIDMVGHVLAQKLLQHFHTPQNIFIAKEKELLAVEGLGLKRAKAVVAGVDEKAILKEIAFIKRHHINTHFIDSDQYPPALRNCPDAPMMLFSKGNQPILTEKAVAVIGTRNNSEYGAKATEELIEGLKDLNVAVISGLAFGIDAIAHRKALQAGLPTFGVLAHGLDRIYPAMNKNLAKEILEQGLLITEYPSGTNPDKQNFPMRNRIVAGMADVTIVVETDVKGGAMITAKLASSYNREVAAFPGRAIDVKSNGCNYLIKTNIAQLITGAGDLLEMMGWQHNTQRKSVQAKLFSHLSAEELAVVELLKNVEAMHVDEMSLKTRYSPSSLASLLLTLEFQNVIKSLPGKRYRLC